MTYKCPYCGRSLKFEEEKSKLLTYRKCDGYIAGKDRTGCGMIFKIDRSNAPELILEKVIVPEVY